jgi:hypothetical protein
MPPGETDPGGDLGNPPVDDAGNVLGTDPGRVTIRRMSDTEYNNTVRDLLGTATRPAFGSADEAFGFDNIAGAMNINTAQLTSYMDWADGLVAEALADANRASALIPCQQAAAGDVSCATQIIDAFGARAWRRPLTAEESGSLVQLYSQAQSLGEDHTQAISRVLSAMLASPNFLYRIEFDPDPNVATPHALNGYEHASRLSYFVWGTMPDDALFTAAADGSLLNPESIRAQVDRMLADPTKSIDFVRSFAGQWLGMRDMENHVVDEVSFPDWDESLRAAMINEAYGYFTEFLLTDRPYTDFLTADFNIVDDRLAGHYGLTVPAGGGRVEDTTDVRAGFLGLASFLTVSSFPRRTSPTLRAKWVMEYLMCTPPPDPPADLMVTELEESETAGTADPANVRERLEAHRAEPLCAGCHEPLDPIGLGLENYDGVGRYRTTYENGDVIDASGTLPTGATFSGIGELSQILAADPRFTACAAQKMFIYALGRGIDRTADTPYIDQIKSNWQAAGGSIRSLMTNVALSDTFTHRRGEVPPATL